MEGRGIGGAQTAAVGGIQRAGKLLEKSAAQIANVSVERQKLEAGPAATVAISPEGRSLVASPSDLSSDLASAFVDQSVAKQLTAANVKVLQTADETLRDLVTGSRKKA